MLRMMLYIVTVCSFCMTGAVLFTSYYASHQARQEVAGQAVQLHEQSVLRLQQMFNELDRMVRQVGNDYAVQRLLRGSELQDTAEDRGLREYIDYLIRERSGQLPLMKEMCISFEGLHYAVCTQSEKGSGLLDNPTPSMRRNERSLRPASAADRQLSGYDVIYTAPLSDRNNVVKGSVQVLVDMSAVMKEIYGKMPLTGNRLTEAGGELIYAGTPEDRLITADTIKSAEETGAGAGGREPVQLQWTEQGFILQKRVELPGAVWYSRIVLPQALDAAQKNAFVQTIALLAGLLLLLIVLCAFLLRRYFLEPLLKLKQLMNRAELGDFRAYWGRHGSREWNELGESYNQMLNRLEELIKQVKREEALKKEAEMEALQYQLNPHFLYNTLNTIKWVAKLHRTPQIAEVVTSLVRLLQASLGKKGDFITVREEMELIRDYMEIQAFRYGDKIRLESEVEPLANNCLVPRMILQPLIENAIVHGIEPGRQEGCIRIRIWLEMERELLFCQVEDNGVGMRAEAAGSELDAGSGAGVDVSGSAGGRGGLRERMSGIGLRHIREKIKLYYGDGYSMHITGKPNQGTIIRLTLPVHQSEVE